VGVVLLIALLILLGRIRGIGSDTFVAAVKEIPPSSAQKS
jgi:hypothetical protein